jgi:uncharacterized protein (TIGR02145 family)
VFPVSKAGNVEISVVNLAGQVIVERQFSLEAGKHSVLLPALASGVYLACIRSQTAAVRVVKWLSTGEGTQTANIRLGGDATVDLPLTASVEVKEKASQAKPAGVIRLLPPEKQLASVDDAGIQTIKPLLYTVSEEENIVEMLYAEGDLLRFTGKNGNMTTIVMNAPTCSHDITFDFYSCTDAGGHHYTILTVGGMLWMAEDLRMIPNVSIASNTTEWTDAFTSNAAKAAYYNYDNANSSQGAFYNYAGAKAALPTDWKLPTQGEIDYMLNALGGYSVAGAALKSRESGTWSVAATGIDSISFNGVAAGILDEQGAFVGKGSLMRYWTRSTVKLKPSYWGVQNADVQNAANQQAINNFAYTGLRVRGCRPAPSVYNDVIELLFQERSTAPGIKQHKAFENGPLGGNYTVADNRKEFFVAMGSSSVQRAASFNTYSKTCNSYQLSGISTSVQYPNWAYNRIKKAAAKQNKDGYEGFVVAVLNENSSDAKPWLNFSSPTVTLHIFSRNDSTNTYVQNIQTLNDVFSMPASMNGTDLGTQVSDIRKGYINTWLFHLRTGDLNDDGVDDIIITVHDKMVVYDGDTYTKMFEQSYSSYYSTVYNNGRAIFLRAETGDIDGDGATDLIVASSSPADNTPPKLFVYLGKENDFQNGTLTVKYNSGFLPGDANYKTSVNIAVGNVNSDGKDEIIAVFKNSSRKQKLACFRYDSIEIAKRIYNVVEPDYFDITMEALTLAKFRGNPAPADIVTANSVYRIDERNGVIAQQGSCILTNTNLIHHKKEKYQVYSDMIIAGNFDGNTDDREQVIYMIANDESGNYVGTINMDDVFSLCFGYNASGSSFLDVDIPFLFTSSGGSTSKGFKFTDYTFPVFAAVRSTKKSTILKFVKNYTSVSDPRIYALLAAPPYYKYNSNGEPYEYNNFGSMGTSWGKSQVTGSGTNKASSNSVSAIFGFEQEFNVPIVGTKVGGVEFTAKLESEWTNSTQKEITTTQSIEFTTSQQDAIVLTATFFDTHTYEVIASDNPDEIGSLLDISLPSTTRTMGLTLNDYERLIADSKGAPNLRRLFQHKEGYPFTYPSDKSHIQSNTDGEILWAMPFGGDEFISIGSGTDVNRSITLDNTTKQTAGFNFKMDMELVATVMGVKAGAGYGHGETNESSHTEGVGHSIAGNVLGVSRLGDVPDFRWTVCWYKYQLGGQTFPVIYYVVKP